MQHINNGIKTLLNDFVEFGKRHNKNINTDELKSLIEPFLQSDQSQPMVTIDSVSETSETVEPAVVKKVSPKSASKNATPKPASNDKDIYVEDFQRLTVSDVQQKSSKWLVNSMKTLCCQLNIPCKSLTKAQLIDNLIQYKKAHQNTISEEQEATGENPVIDEAQSIDAPLVSVEECINSAQKRPGSGSGAKRRIMSAAITQKTVEIIRQHNLNLVLSDAVILVLSDDKRLVGFIPRESYEANLDDKQEVKKVTKEVVRLAQEMGIDYDISELPDE